jgi:hypothetical protein
MVRSFVSPLLILALVGPAAAQDAPLRSSPSLEFETSLDDLWRGAVSTTDLLGTLAGRAGALKGGERQTQADALHVTFRASLRKDATGRRRLFAHDNREVRAGLAGVLGELGAALRADDLTAMLPPPGRLDDYWLDDVQSAEFAAFARPLWDESCTRRLFAALEDRAVVARPAWFLAHAWLGYQVLPSAVHERLPAALRRAYLDRTPFLDEPTLAELFRLLRQSRWGEPSARPLRDGALHPLADHLFRMPVEERAGQLDEEEYMALARHRPAWLDWTKKIAVQVKERRGRNDRAAAVLSRLVQEEGDHFAVLHGQVEPDADVGLFVYLHRAPVAGLSPWRALNQRGPSLRNRSLELLRLLFDPARSARWTVDLLDVLQDDYYDYDADGLYRSVLWAVVVSDRVAADNVVRAELLTRVSDARFPPEAGKRWALAWAAAGDARLAAPIRLTGRSPVAITFLGGVCRGLRVPAEPAAALRHVNATHGRLLQHVYHGLFEVMPGDAAIDDPVVVVELEQLFRQLGELRQRHGWRRQQLESVERFWEKAQAAFEAAVVARDKQRMTALLRFMLRLCIALGDTEQVEVLAREACRRVFEVTPGEPFAVLPDADLDLKTGLFTELAPAFEEAIAAVRKEGPPAGTVNRLVELFERNLYWPLLRTNQFLAKAGEGPWLRLLALYEGPERQRAAQSALLKQLQSVRFLNAPAEVGRLAEHLYAELGVRVWLAPGRLVVDADPSRPLAGQLGENFPLQWIKHLLDASRTDVERTDAQVGAILELFLTGLPRDDFWLTSRQYDARGRPTAATTADRRAYLPYLAQLVTFHEARVAPFERNGERVDPARLKFRYVLGSRGEPDGPAFELPEEGRTAHDVWSRFDVSGRNRLRLLEAMRDLLPDADPRAVRDRAAVALLLPNRVRHVARDEVDSLPHYRDAKAAVAADLKRVLARTASPGEQFALLQALLRLRYSFGPDQAAPLLLADLDGAVAAGMDRLGKGWLRALAYERLALQRANPDAGDAGGGLAHVVRVLLDDLKKDRDLDGEGGTVAERFQLLHRALHAGWYLAQVEPADVLAFDPLLEALEEAPARGISAEVGRQVLMAYAMVLPIYGGQPEQFLGGIADGRDLDRLILFTRLSSAAKKVLTAWVVEPPPGPGAPGPADLALMRDLLIQHNNVSLILAERVFENRALLMASRNPVPYSVVSLDYAILYRRHKSFTLTAEGLLGGAVAGCAQNFRLARAGRPNDDAAVLAFLFTGAGTGSDGLAPMPLDRVLRVPSCVVPDPRYEGDTEAQEAAREFQASARAFIENPPALPWFGPDPVPLRDAATYLEAGALAGDAIVAGSWRPWLLPGEAAAEPRSERSLRWEAESRVAHARLWRNLLFGPGKAPLPWAAAFARGFCTGRDLPAQRRELVRLVTGASEGPDAPASFRGLQQVLAGVERLPPDSPGGQYGRAFWAAADAVLNAAAVGRGLSERDAFLARPFLEGPGGRVKALSAKRLEACTKAATDMEQLFDALDFPWQWDARFSDSRLRGLIGSPLEKCVRRAGRGLGAAGPAEEEKAAPSYRLAAWRALSESAAEELAVPIGTLDRASRVLEADPPAHRLATARGQQQPICDAVRTVVHFRLRHDRCIKALTRRSELAAGSPDAARDAAWSWYRADVDTLRWARDRVTRTPWPLLAAVWAPFASYAGLDNAAWFPDAPALGLAPTAWQGDKLPEEVGSFTLLYLLDHVELARDGLRLAPRYAESYAGLHAHSPWELDSPPNADGCLTAVAAWVDLDAWRRLSDPAILQAGPRLRGYEHRVIPAAEFGRLRAGRLEALTTAALDVCQWTAPPSAEWCRRYQAKMAYAEASAAAGHAEGAWLSAAGLPFRVACRAEPCAGPFVAEYDEASRSVLLLRAPRPVWPGALRRLPPDQRGDWKKKLAEMCVIQREVRADGSLAPVRAGFLGYVDFLAE